MTLAISEPVSFTIFKGGLTFPTSSLKVFIKIVPDLWESWLALMGVKSLWGNVHTGLQFGSSGILSLQQDISGYSSSKEVGLLGSKHSES